MLVGTNLQYANSFNNRIVLETIRLFGPLSRVEIARKTQLTAQTVTNITKKLIAGGLVLEDSRYQDGRGAPSIRLKINENAAFSIGIDFDKDHMTTIMLNLKGKICQKQDLELDFPTPEEALELMHSTADSLIEKEAVDRERIWGVGVALPGPMVPSSENSHSNLVNPVALPGWDNVPIAKQLEERLKLPVVMENNASAAAIGEHWYGQAQHIRSFFYIYFGAGLGGGLVINGQLHSGHTGNAGEMGYFPTPIFPDDHIVCEHDHLGGFFNMPLLMKKMKDAGCPVSSLKDLKDYYESRNSLLEGWLDTGTRYLAPLILAIEYLIDPEVIYFGGRLPQSMLLSLLEKLEKTVPEHRVDRKVSHPGFRIASAGIDAAALGVATLPLYTSFAPLPKLLMKKKHHISDMFVRAYDQA